MKNIKSAGFTVIEILIAALLAGIVTTAAMSLYLTQHKQLIVQDDISDMQSNVRAATAELASKIRMAGYKVPGSISLVAYNTNPDTIYVTYDQGVTGDIQLSQAMTQVTSNLVCNGYPLTGVSANDWLFIYDVSAQVGEYFQASQVNQGTFTISHTSMALSRLYPIGSRVYKIIRYKYYIDRTDVNHPNLMQKAGWANPQIYAENITSLNLQYVLSSGAIVDVPGTPDMVREVLITVAARTNQADNEFATQYRGRTLTTRVKVRNLGVN